MTKRINLARVKEVLNKIPTEELECCFIMHPYGTETPDDDSIGLIKFGDDWEEFFGKYDCSIITKFAKAIQEDVKICLVVKDNIDLMEDYAEDMEC